MAERKCIFCGASESERELDVLKGSSGDIPGRLGNVKGDPIGCPPCRRAFKEGCHEQAQRMGQGMPPL